MIEDPNTHGREDPGSSRDEFKEVEFNDSSSWGMKITLVLIALIAGIAVTYGWLQHNAAQQLAVERADMNTALAQARTQTDQLAAKVSALTAAQAQEAATRAQAEAAKNEQFVPRNGDGSQHPRRHIMARREPVDDPRWKQFQKQLGDQQNALADNKQQLAKTQADLEQAKSELGQNLDSTRTALSGDIARNHEELVALEKKGERNYYEFNFPKSKAFHHAGPVSLQLTRANSKRSYCDLQLIVNDSQISRKHVSLYESISLYPQGYPLPIEVVINHISKDSIQGYVSEPKVRITERPTASVIPPAPAPTTASVTPAAPPAPDVKLEHREEVAH